MERKYNPKEHFVRNRILFPAVLRIVGVPLVRAKDAHFERYRPKNKTFLLIANHNEILDPAYEMVSLMRYVRFVSSDHVVRDGLKGKLLNYFGTPIVKYRNKPREVLIEDILATLHEGVSVGIHAEGGMSYNGESRYISPNTAKLAKDADCAVITFRSFGGYMRSPRWKKHHRKGPLYGGVVKEYDREEISRMSQQEVYEAICRDLYVNAYEEQREKKLEYVGENLAESCEIVLYRCPVCKQTAKLHSSGNFLTCECGYRVEMKPDGFFYGCGREAVYDNICDWEHWQRDSIPDYLEAFRNRPDEPIFRDEGQIMKRITGGKEMPVCDSAVLELYADRLEISWEEKRSVLPLSEIQKMDYVKWQSLLVVTKEDYFDFGSVIPRSATKYVDAWRYLTGKPNY